jgi:cytochrome b
VRFLHWGLAICVAANLINDGDGIKDLHHYVGYAASVFVFLRLGLGFLGKGSPAAHHLFRNWPLSLLVLLGFIKSELSKNPMNFEGHNPLACWTYIGIWISVLALGATGFVMGLDAFWGEEWLEDLHAIISNILMVLVAAHFLGFMKDAIKFRRKTWMRMISGRY